MRVSTEGATKGDTGEEEVEESFEDIVRRATAQVGLVETDNFIAKICNMREIIKVRWSVFVLGDAATGKSAIWKTLQAALTMSGEKTNLSVRLTPCSRNANEFKLIPCIYSIQYCRPDYESKGDHNVGALWHC